MPEYCKGSSVREPRVFESGAKERAREHRLFLENLAAHDLRVDEAYEEAISNPDIESARGGLRLDLLQSGSDDDERIKRISALIERYDTFTGYIEEGYGRDEPIEQAGGYHRREILRKLLTAGYVDVWALNEAVTRLYGNSHSGKMLNAFFYVADRVCNAE